MELNGSTESEFLSIGMKLQDFYGRAKQISDLSSSVAKLLFGAQIADIIDRTRTLNERIRLVEDTSSRGTAVLQGIRGTIQSISIQLNGFHKIVLQLRMLCLTIKVESARLSGDNLSFDILASDVGKLAFEIEQKCASLQEWSSKLGVLIQKTLLQVSGLEAALKHQSNVILEKTMRNLESLRTQHQLAKTGAEELAKSYQSVTRSIEEVITSLQFHDITRQQIEHAQQALDDIAGEFELQKSPMRRFGGKTLERLLTAGEVCKLQKAQIVHASNELIAATKRICDNLRDVARNVSEMATETRTLMGCAEETGGSFLKDIELGFSSLSVALADHERASSELSDTTRSVGHALEQMSAFAADIEAIGFKIKLVALNAIVKAAQIGDAGASLAVLAERIHVLSTETCERTDVQSSSLRSVASASAVLDEGMVETGGEAPSEAGSIAEEMEKVLGSLREINTSIVSMQNRIENDGRELSREIENTVSQITVHEEVGRVCEEVTSELDGIMAFLHSLTPSFLASGGPKNLGGLESAYTMESERKIHDSLSRTHATHQKKGNGDGAAINSEEIPVPTDSHETFSPGPDNDMASPPDYAPAGEKPVSGETDDLGENVELF